MSDSDDDKPLGARKAEVKAEKMQKEDESDDDKPLGKLKKESAGSKIKAASDDEDEESDHDRESGDEDGEESGDEDEESDDEDEESEDKTEQVELRLRVRAGQGEAEEIVRVRPDSVDLTAHTGLEGGGEWSAYHLRMIFPAKSKKENVHKGGKYTSNPTYQCKYCQICRTGSIARWRRHFSTQGRAHFAKSTTGKCTRGRGETKKPNIVLCANRRGYVLAEALRQQVKQKAPREAAPEKEKEKQKEDEGEEEEEEEDEDEKEVEEWKSSCWECKKGKNSTRRHSKKQCRALLCHTGPDWRKGRGAGGGGK
jgi:hypothetical protein